MIEEERLLLLAECEALTRMFAGEGWSYFQATLERDIASLNNVSDIKDARELHQMQGAIKALENIRALESMTDQLHEGLQDQQDEDEDI